MAMCVKCRRQLASGQVVWVAPAPIGQRAIKCQACGRFSEAEILTIAAQLNHHSYGPQARLGLGGCDCLGTRARSA